MDKTVVNDLLVARRKRKKLKQSEIAKILGINQRTYQRKERGNLNFDELNAICKILDLKLVLIPIEIIT